MCLGMETQEADSPETVVVCVGCLKGGHGHAGAWWLKRARLRDSRLTLGAGQDWPKSLVLDPGSVEQAAAMLRTHQPLRAPGATACMPGDGNRPFIFRCRLYCDLPTRELT